MKMRYLLAFALSLYASAAHAEKWVKTYSNEAAVAYVDTDSIVRKGDLATARFKRDYVDGVERKDQDADGKWFSIARSMSVLTFECAGARHAAEQLWTETADGKTRSPTTSYPMNRNNDTWDAAARKAVCP